MVLKQLHLTILEFRFLAKISKERIDSEKVLGSSQNMKEEIVRSMECNSTISPFLGRWQNLTESKKHTEYIHNIQDNNWDRKEYFIHNEWMYMNYKKNKKYILVFSTFLSFKP